MSAWMRNTALCANILTPTETVVLRNPKNVSHPPQAIVSVGVSSFKGSRQLCDCLNKTHGAETTAATNPERNGAWSLGSKDGTLHQHLGDTPCQGALHQHLGDTPCQGAGKRAGGGEQHGAAPVNALITAAMV
jgi:hypothetical protein